jgi:HSP20 family protein
MVFSKLLDSLFYCKFSYKNPNITYSEWNTIIPSIEATLPLNNISGKRFENCKFSSPKKNVNDSKNEYIITKEIPGFHKEEISLDVQDGILIIKGKKKNDLEYPISIKPFTDSYLLGNDVDINNISANLENGILTITAPKKLKECKKIKIL